MEHIAWHAVQMCRITNQFSTRVIVHELSDYWIIGRRH